MFGLLSRKRSGFRAEYDRDVEQNLARPIDTPPLAESDLAPLPPAVQRYIRLNGAVGQSRVRNFRARFHGQIRSGPNARWMSFTGEQHNFYGAASGPSRFFLMDASTLGIPFRVYHRYLDAHATMRVKAASLLTMVDAKGPEMDAAETVTVFNDLCVFAPGALLDHDIPCLGFALEEKLHMNVWKNRLQELGLPIAAAALAVDDLVALVPPSNELHDRLGRMLQVAIHDDNAVALGLTQARDRRCATARRR